MFEATTQDIRVQVEPTYVREESNPGDSYYFFAYKVRIHNGSTRSVQLLSRHWIITDGFGQVEEVEGAGVVGVQPLLRPGESFEYSSFCPLVTPTGSMEGTYMMADEKGATWKITIPKFLLADPSHFH